MRNFYEQKGKPALLCFLCLFFGFFFTIPYLAYAVTQDDLDNANQSVNDLKAEQASLSGELSQLNTNLERMSSHLASLEASINEKQAAADSLNAEIIQLNADIDKRYESMKLRIRYMYERDSDGIFDILLSSKSLADFLTKGEYISQLTSYDREQLQALEDIFARQNEAKQTLDTQLAELQTLKADAQNEQNQIHTLIEQYQKQYDDTSNNVSEAEQRALAYEQQLEQERIERERAEAEEASREAASREAAHTAEPVSHTPVAYDSSDLAMLAAIIECEAGGEPYFGQLAVGSVVLNRVNSSRFANSISSVIYSPGQFTPVASGRFAMVLARGARDTCVQAAQEVLGGNIVTDALYFHMYRSSDTYGTVIGNHIFY